MKTINITVSDHTYEQIEKLVVDFQTILDADKGYKYTPVTKDKIIKSAINSEYLRRFQPNPMNIVLLPHAYMQLKELIEKETEVLRNFPLCDISDQVTPLSVVQDLIEKEYKRNHKVDLSTGIPISDEDLPI